jgi:hypothetical protein
MGAWGGRLNPEFSSTEVSQRARTLWSDPLESDCWASFPYRAAAPVGGGMFLRREVATSYANQLANDPVRKSLDRSGKGLSSAGDIDLAYCACDVGLGIGRFPDLELTHLIPESRCTDEYLDRLVEGFGFSETILQFVRGQKIDFPQCFIDRLVFRYKRMRSLKFSSRNRLCRERGIRKAFRELQVLQTTQ